MTQRTDAYERPHIDLMDEVRGHMDDALLNLVDPGALDLDDLLEARRVLNVLIRRARAQRAGTGPTKGGTDG